MNELEAAKLLSLIKLSYPTSYRGIDMETATATVGMWAMSFPDVPYPIIEQAFNHYRMGHKFPPTVAEMVEELRYIYNEALEGALVQKGLGNQQMAEQYWMIMDYTARYKNSENLGGLQLGSLQGLLNGGGGNVGTSRNWLDRENRLPFLDAGGE